MTLFILAYAAGVLTIASPCILPILPFVLARADQPFRRSGLPLLLGLAVTFAAVASLAAVAGGWAVELNHHGRTVALAVMTLFGLTMLFPALATRVMAPLVSLGSRITDSVSQPPERRRDNGGFVGPARRRDRLCLGAVRRPGDGLDPDRSRAAWARASRPRCCC